MTSKDIDTEYYTEEVDSDIPHGLANFHWKRNRIMQFSVIAVERRLLTT